MEYHKKETRILSFVFALKKIWLTDLGPTSVHVNPIV
jgi:hypothetical protein